MRCRSVQILIVLLTIALPFQSLCAEPEEESMSPKIGPLLRDEIWQTTNGCWEEKSDCPALGETEVAVNLIAVVVVMHGNHLEPLTDNVLAELEEMVEALGGRVGDHAFKSVMVWMPADKIPELANWSEIRILRKPIEPVSNNIVSEGVGLIGTPDWHRSGFQGSGVSVGVLDKGFQGYADLLGTELPESVTTKEFGSSGSFNSSTHGTACAEIVCDMAPRAEMFLANAGDIYVGFHTAASWLKSQGVDVVSCSYAINSLALCVFYHRLLSIIDLDYILLLSLVYGSDYALQIVKVQLEDIGDQLTTFLETKEQWDYTIDNMVLDGVTWCQAAGNDAEKKWKGWFNDTDGDNFHNFTPGRDINRIEFSGYGSEVYVLMQWDLDADSPPYDDYDLYVVGVDGRVFAKSDTPQSLIPLGLESCRFTPKSYIDYYVAVKKVSGVPRELFLLIGQDNYPNFQYNTPESTILLNPPAHNPNVITVGAVSYFSPHTIEWYSANGPTNEGYIKPDLVAPARVSVSSRPYVNYISGFAGTSAAAPHVAGACALVRQAYPTWSPGEVKTFLEANAIDLGVPGKDNVYGSGLVDLAAVVPSVITPPSGVAASDGTYTDRVEVTWDPVDQATAYDVYRSISPGSTKTNIGSTSGNTYEDMTAAASTTYYYWVTASNAHGESDFSSYDVGWRGAFDPPVASISVSPESLQFGDVATGANSELAVTIANTGTADLTLGTLRIAGADKTQFSGLGGCPGGMLTPAGTCTVIVLFSPTSGGAKSGTLVIESDDPNTPTLNVPLRGTGGLGTPHSATDPATSVASTSATLNGTVNPNGLTTTYHFEYGATLSYGSTTPDTSAGAGTSDVSVNARITGLDPDTTYHFRIVATNSAGTTHCADRAFTTQTAGSGGGGGGGSCFIGTAANRNSKGDFHGIMRLSSCKK